MSLTTVALTVEPASSYSPTGPVRLALGVGVVDGMYNKGKGGGGLEPKQELVDKCPRQGSVLRSRTRMLR